MRKSYIFTVIVFFLLFVCFSVCQNSCADREKEQLYSEIYPANIVEVSPFYYFKELDGIIARFSTVMFDKYSMAIFTEVFSQEDGLKGVKRVLDVGTGTGALAFAALAYGAEEAVGTELDPLAIDNARFNAKQLGVSDRFEARLVPLENPEAYSVFGIDEKFDLIISDPPQGYKEKVTRAFTDLKSDRQGAREVFFSRDRDFTLLTSLISGLPYRLSENGRAIVALKASEAKKKLIELAEANNLEVKVLYDINKDFDPKGKRFIGEETHVPDMSKTMIVYELRVKK